MTKINKYDNIKLSFTINNSSTKKEVMMANRGFDVGKRSSIERGLRLEDLNRAEGLDEVGDHILGDPFHLGFVTRERIVDPGPDPLELLLLKEEGIPFGTRTNS